MEIHPPPYPVDTACALHWAVLSTTCLTAALPPTHLSPAGVWVGGPGFSGVWGPVLLVADWPLRDAARHCVP
jgi:hypothetical protein